MKYFFALLMVGAGIGLVIYAVQQQREEPIPIKQTIGTNIGEFALTERSGQLFYGSELKGKVWVASYFFATCPSACVKQNQIVKQLQDEFGDEGVKFVSITCDPKTDTPEKLRDYASSLQANPDQWYFLTGDLNYIREIGRDAFKIAVAEKTHANRLMLIDKWGNVRGSYNWPDSYEVNMLRDNIKKLMDEEAPPAGLATDSSESSAQDEGEDADEEEAASDASPADTDSDQENSGVKDSAEGENSEASENGDDQQDAASQPASDAAGSMEGQAEAADKQ